jgi:hypothetical protein
MTDVGVRKSFFGKFGICEDSPQSILRLIIKGAVTIGVRHHALHITYEMHRLLPNIIVRADVHHAKGSEITQFYEQGVAMREDVQQEKGAFGVSLCPCYCDRH